jgi:hypothetical protein
MRDHEAPASEPPRYIVASRQGLYLASRQGIRKLVPGFFFGVTVLGPAVYAFRTVSQAAAQEDPNTGSIVRFRFQDGELSEPEILVRGLDHNCHQVDFFDGLFWVVDCTHQRMLAFDKEWRVAATHAIDRRPGREVGDAHINSFLGREGRLRVLLHNQRRGIPSEIVEFDRSFREIGRTSLPDCACHDLVELEDGSILFCNSYRGQIALLDGPHHQIDELFTRGLSVGSDEIAVGSSTFGKRLSRELLPGFVTFLDRSYRRVGRFYLPAAPTQIRRLDGDDLSFSSPRV